MKLYERTMRQFSSRSYLLNLLAVILLFTTNSFAQGSVEAGEKLFKANCSACHGWDKKLAGPALQGVVDRVQAGAYKDVDNWLKEWIKDNGKVRASGDAYGNQVFNANNGGAMSSFGFLSDAQLTDLVAFLHVGPKPKEKTAETSTAAKTTEVKDENADLWLILIVIGVSALIIIIFTGVNRSMKNIINEREGRGVDEPKSIGGAIKHWASNNKKIASIIGVIIFLTICKLGWDWAFEIGVYTNYQPKQPIAFPHDLHAGKNKIDCKYCHSSARYSKTSGIPSANVCMNCHKGISEGSRTGTKEINKLYEYVGWNTDSAKYTTKNGEIREDVAIEWVKVHNLPDFVYYNHSQHVEVGKIPCQKCHGPVEEMAEVKQFSPLTMAWCVECHRETEVNFAGNDYYIKIHEDAKEEYKHKKDFKFTVEKIGGLECAKCHY